MVSELNGDFLGVVERLVFLVGGTMLNGDEEEKWIQRDVFHTCTSQGKVCNMIINSGCFENLVSIEMVQKLGLETVPHPNPYQVWITQRFY